MDFSLNKIFTVPNLLSLSRIVMVPFVGWFLFQDTVEGAMWAGVLLSIAIMTDFLDGFFARLLNQISDLGKILDPLADKFFVAVLVVELIFLRDFPVWIAIILVAKDLAIVLASALIVGKNKVVLPSNIIGKYAFGMQAGLILSYFLKFHYGIWFFTISTIIFVALSMISYGRVMLYVLKHAKEGKELKVPQPRQYVPAWLRRALVTIAALVYFAHLYFWAFENNEIAAAEMAKDFEVITGAEKLAEQFLPQIKGKGEKFLDAAEFFENAEIKTGSRYFMGMFDNSEDEVSPYSYISASQDNNDQVSNVYFRVSRLLNSERKINYFIQYWFFCAREDKPVERAGDWQMLGVCLSEYKEPRFLVLTQGWFVRVMPWPQVEPDDPKPTVVAGEGSNSFYAGSELTTYLDQEGVVSVGEDAISQGEVISNIKLIELNEDSDWLKWPGHWGGPQPAGNRGPLWWNPKNGTIAPMRNPQGFLNFYFQKQGEE